MPGRLLIDQVHAIIEGRAESGKVLSLSAFEVMAGLYGGRLGGVELALIENSSDEVNEALVAPFYFADDKKPG